MVRKYFRLVKDIENEKIQMHLIKFCLRLQKVLLKCKLIPRDKEQKFLTKNLMILKQVLQKNTRGGEENRLIDIEILSTLSDVLTLAYFNLKDLNFE